MATVSSTVSLYIVQGAYFPEKSAEKPSSISQLISIDPQQTQKSIQFLSYRPEQCRTSNNVVYDIKVEDLTVNPRKFFPQETEQKIESLRAAFFCDRIKALSFVPYNLDQKQTLFTRKTDVPCSKGLIKPFKMFKIDDTPYVDPTKLGEYISSLEDIEKSIQDLQDIEPETKVFLRNILTSFLADPSTEIIGISYVNSTGEEKLGIWKKISQSNTANL